MVPASGTATQRSSYFLNGQLVAVRTVTGSTTSHYFTYADQLDNVSAMSYSGGTFYNGSYAQYEPFRAYQTQPSTNPGRLHRPLLDYTMRDEGYEFSLHPFALI